MLRISEAISDNPWRMKRAIFFIFWSFLTLLIVTIPDATGSATATPTTAETPTAAITAIDPLTGTPERRITFGGNSGYQPFEWEDQGMPLGFNIDLAKAVSKAGDIPAEFKLGNWAEILEAFEQGEVDVLAMYVSDERARLFRFSTPFTLLITRFMAHQLSCRYLSLLILPDNVLQLKRVPTPMKNYSQKNSM
ncbi:transporter substrate-binding domain-containing protein [Pseudidiomarina halophila]|uniref:transporter substrate-binding domain-containing protein n=1 Tax=Pseudidiomarina halophila TaxID=1449799 RepID=UPI00361A60F5